MKIKIVFIYIVIASNTIIAQSIQDTIDNPYWSSMMRDKSISIHKTKRAFDLYFSNKEKIKGSGWKQFERWYHNALFVADQNGIMAPGDHVLIEMNKFKKNNLSARGGGSGNWVCHGPFVNPLPVNMNRGVGRIASIAFNPNEPNTLYAGAPAGGFWKSVDRGQNWITTTADYTSLGVSAIAVISEGVGEPTILIGTGDRDINTNPDAPGLGVYISTDGGASFSPSSIGMGNKTVCKFVVNPENNNTILAATENGIYRSHDKGASWKVSSSSVYMYDIDYNPADTNIVYACNANSFYRSIDGGVTWSISNSGLSSASKSRLGIAVTKANPNIVYLLASNSSNDLEGVYKSSNQGLSFSKKASSPNMLSGQGWYNLDIEGSDLDSNTVFVGGLDVYRSLNGGTSFTAVSSWFGGGRPWVHADCHVLTRNPHNNELWMGTDGGLDYTQNEGTSFVNVNNNLPISQFYNLGVSQLSKDDFITGAQDNGTSTGNTSNQWIAQIGGDGMECEMSNFSLQNMVGSAQYGALQRTINGGNSWNNGKSGITEAGQWVVPFQLHPRVDNINIAVFKNVWISKNIFGTATPTYIKASNGIVATGSAIRFSNSNDSIVYAGWSDGSLRVCNNLFANSPTFTSISSPGSGKVNDIETSYSDQNVLWVAKGTKVFRSRNGGTSWTDITGNLPFIIIYTLVLDKYSSEGIYVGTASGVYYRDSTMSSWKMFSNGLAMTAQVRDLEIVFDQECSKNSVIMAATYGRGLWRSNVYVDSNGFLSVTRDKIGSFCGGEKIIVTCDGGEQYNITPTTNSIKLADNTFELSPMASTVYTITSKNSLGICDLKTVDITTLKPPIVKVTPTSKTVNLGDTLVLTASGASSYSWSPNTTSIGSTSSSSFKSNPRSNVTYTVTGTSSNGCKSTAKSIITVNGGVGIQAASNFDFSIFPNPANSVINISSKSIYKTRIFDINGKLVLEENSNSLDKKIDISKLSNGTYMIENLDDKGNSKTSKFSIER